MQSTVFFCRILYYGFRISLIYATQTCRKREPRTAAPHGLLLIYNFSYGVDRKTVLIPQLLQGYPLPVSIHDSGVPLRQLPAAAALLTPGPVPVFPGRDIDISGLYVFLQFLHQVKGRTAFALTYFMSAHSLSSSLLRKQSQHSSQRHILLHAGAAELTGFAWSQTLLFFFLFLHMILSFQTILIP